MNPAGEAAATVVLQGGFRFHRQPLFSDVRVSLLPAAWTCLLGHSGTGKSTLLRIFAGLDTGGEFEGSITAGDGSPWTSTIAYMAQSDLLFPWLSVRENVVVGARLRGDAVDLARADHMIERVGLASHFNKRPAALSGGMRQRTALARTLMEDAELLLLDEPFSALDARTRAEMQELAFEVLKGRTVLLVTHDPAESARLASRIYLMTEHGIEPHPVAATPPIRDVGDAGTLQCQASLMAALRAPRRITSAGP